MESGNRVRINMKKEITKIIQLVNKRWNQCCVYCTAITNMFNC